MSPHKVQINWPDGSKSIANTGDNWLITAKKAGIEIPSGCLGGSCRACEIETNGTVCRACISEIPEELNIKVDFADDPYW